MSLGDPPEEREEAHRAGVPSSLVTLSDEDISARLDREIGILESLGLTDQP